MFVTDIITGFMQQYLVPSSDATAGVSKVGVDLWNIYASIIANVDLLSVSIWASGGLKGRNTIKKYMCPWSSEMFQQSQNTILEDILRSWRILASFSLAGQL